MNENILIRVQNLKMFFPVSGGIGKKNRRQVQAVNDVSFEIRRGETLGLVGESGCGKSTTAQCVMRIYNPTGGKIIYDGIDITHLNQKNMRKYRKKMQLIFQDPYASLNPRMTVGEIIGEPLVVHKIVKKDTPEYIQRITELMKQVELNPDMLERYPHEFSGGQRQRIGIARALAANPDFIVCDEPVSALDVSVQAQILKLLIRLREEKGLTYLFIAHDLAVVRNISDRVIVMYLGKIMEISPSDSLYDNPVHPYTISLLSAVPVPDPEVDRKRERILLKGDVPSPIDVPKGCPFHDRCTSAIEKCACEAPPLKEIEKSHFVACWNAEKYGEEEKNRKKDQQLAKNIENSFN